MKDIILIGMPGSGKSTVGVVLAKKLGLHFVDSDLKMQEKSGKLLHELIEQLGPEGFWQFEDQINGTLLSGNRVIATGGSAVYGKTSMEQFTRKGIVIYLKLSLEEIASRLGNLKERGVTLKEGQTLAELYAERIPLYEKYAGLTFDCERKEIREIVEEIASKIRKLENES